MRAKEISLLEEAVVTVETGKAKTSVVRFTVATYFKKSEVLIDCGTSTIFRIF